MYILKFSSIAMLSLLPAVSTFAQTDFTSYHIGNSLTWDSQPTELVEMSARRDVNHTVGYHIRCGSSLAQIVADDVTCVDPVEAFGTWRSALPANNFNAITMQPHTSGGATLASDQANILEMIDTAINGVNSYQDTRFLIYQAWPQLGTAPDDYAEKWQTPTADADSTSMTYTADYFEHLITRVRAERPDATVDMIPVGQVMFEIDAQLKSGQLVIPGYTDASDFYREDVRLHMNALGRFVAASTTYAVLMDDDPQGIPAPALILNRVDSPASDWDAELLTPEVQADLQAIVWDVVSQHPYTSVPEPGSMLLLATGAGLIGLRRRRDAA